MGKTPQRALPELPEEKALREIMTRELNEKKRRKNG